eukprot:691685-Rhodomonas_salina.2
MPLLQARHDNTVRGSTDHFFQAKQCVLFKFSPPPCFTRLSVSLRHHLGDGVGAKRTPSQWAKKWTFGGADTPGRAERTQLVCLRRCRPVKPDSLDKFSGYRGRGVVRFHG